VGSAFLSVAACVEVGSGAPADAADQADDAADDDDGADATPDGPDAAPAIWRCATGVAHIGDSLTYYTQRDLTEAYAEVGASVTIDAYGGRAVKQKIAADPRTGEQAAAKLVGEGFDGCWVVALGTNDTANIAAGAWYDHGEAIDTMMMAIDPTEAAPVMWVNTFTTKTTGYWKNANMILWNQALAAAPSRWPNLRVYDWAAVAATGVAPYSDGIHHTTAGYGVRDAAIAEALVATFPKP
jgi:hypothetical protein